jgi:hypothetical protein
VFCKRQAALAKIFFRAKETAVPAAGLFAREHQDKKEK